MEWAAGAVDTAVQLEKSKVDQLPSPDAASCLQDSALVDAEPVSVVETHGRSAEATSGTHNEVRSRAQTWMASKAEAKGGWRAEQPVLSSAESARSKERLVAVEGELSAVRGLNGLTAVEADWDNWLSAAPFEIAGW